MIDYVDIQYAQSLAGRMERFKVTRTNPYRINFRCPLCGDSQKSRSKARGWLLEKDNSFVYYCHNCNASQSFSYFLKQVDPLAFKSYVSEKFMSKHKKPGDEKSILEKTTFETPKFNSKSAIKSIKKVSQLDHNHYAKLYILEREIPSAQHYRMYYTPKFKTWVNSIIPDKFESVERDEPRLVIPFFDKDKKMFGVSARSFKPDSKLRYITNMFEDKPKIFGLDTVNFANQYYVVEGAFDSMFLKNAVAMAGADGNTNALNNTENAVFVFDSEPRNKEIHKRMEKIIDAGYKIVIWPTDIPGKDINEMVLNGYKDIEGTLRNNVYKGLEAKMKLNYWKKS